MKVLVVHTFNQSQKGNDSVVNNEVELLRSYGVEVELLGLSVAAGGKFSEILKTFFSYSAWLALHAYDQQLTPEKAAAQLIGVYKSLFNTDKSIEIPPDIITPLIKNNYCFSCAIPKSGGKLCRFWGYRIRNVISIFVLPIK